MFKKMRKLIVLILQKIIRLFSGHGFGKFYPIGALYRFLHSSLRVSNYVFDAQGSKMFLDSVDSLGVFRKGIHEPLTTKLFRKEIKKGDIVLDLGAHIGYYTLIFAKAVGEDGKVYSFEPDTENFALLRKNVEINGYKNVVLENKAVSDQSRKNKLYKSNKGSSLHSIYDIHGNHEFVEIESVRLDDYFQDYEGKINWIKIDIEGAEQVALEGMSLLLEKNKNIKIVTEFATCCLIESGVQAEDYFKLLQKYGFYIYSLNDKKNKIETCDVAGLLKTYTLENRGYTNLLCSREKIIL